MTLRGFLGLTRSMWIYRRPGRLRGLVALYRPFVPKSGLVFDVGAHLGDRTRAFRRLGARVVAVEPQPALMGWLERFHARDPDVMLIRQAVGAKPGRAQLALSETHPAVATLSARWREAVAQSHDGFVGVRWSDSVEVMVTTLDDLIERYGRPDFCKIDVEGHELEVLSGLSRPVPSLSLEFVAGALHRSQACIDRLAALGPYRYNAVAGERREFLWADFKDPRVVREWLEAGADGLASGDLYAVLQPERN